MQKFKKLRHRPEANVLGLYGNQLRHDFFLKVRAAVVAVAKAYYFDFARKVKVADALGGQNRGLLGKRNDQLVKKLPWGWVKESVARIKVFGSFPKDVGTAQVMGLLEDNTRDAKNALIDRELIDFV